MAQLTWLVVLVVALLVYYSHNNRPSKKCLPRTPNELIGNASEYIPPPGQFIQLSQGLVHFVLDGPESSETVLLVHGLNENVHHWDNLRKLLRKEGYRVLAFDNYGNGWSEAPDTYYTESLYSGQVTELLFALNITNPVHFVGQSMGGAISSKFSAIYPEKVKSLTLLAPPGITVKTPFVANLVVFPVVADILSHYFSASILLKRAENSYLDPKYESVKRYVMKMLKYQLDHNKDILRVLNRILKDFPLERMKTVYSVLAQHKFPINIIWGSEDSTVPVENANELKELFGRGDVFILPGLGHTAFLQEPDIVNPIIISQIKKSH